MPEAADRLAGEGCWPRDAFGDMVSKRLLIRRLASPSIPAPDLLPTMPLRPAAQRTPSSDLFDPRQGGEPVRTASLAWDRQVVEPARSNYFAIYLIRSGSGTFWADAASFAFEPHALLFFVPYQRIRLVPDSPGQAELIQFHANFLCVETFHAEVGCSGILFNDPYGVPLVKLPAKLRSAVNKLFAQIQQEQSQRQLAHHEAMLAHLKVLLIQATRLKRADGGACARGLNDLRHPILIQLRDLIEDNYHHLHAPADYARLLHITPKTLGRLVREHLGTTPTELIRSRILSHAKWQLLHTLKPVKEIAHEVGFTDELYFSRLFKKATGCSPTFFREFETEIRGGSNLSMFSGKAPIRPTQLHSDT